MQEYLRKTLRTRECKEKVFIASALDTEAANRAKHCTDMAVASGNRAALLTGGLVAIPTLIACRRIPWAKANLNHTAQALIICSSAIAAYFIETEHVIVKCARETSRENIEAKRLAQK